MHKTKIFIPAETADMLRGASAEEQRFMQDMAAELIVEGLRAREQRRGRNYYRFGAVQKRKPCNPVTLSLSRWQIENQLAERSAAHACEA